MFSEQRFCLFYKEQQKCYFVMKFGTYVANMYMFITKKFQNFLTGFTIFSIFI